MVFKRLIFNLYYDDGDFYLSRNFFLQKVGNLDWIKKSFGFENLCNNVDELIITLVTRSPSQKQIHHFLNDVEKFKEFFFLPIVLAGGIRNKNDAKIRFNSGADKIMVNALFHKNSKIINDLSLIYGEQAIIVNCDFLKKNEKYISVYDKAEVNSYTIVKYIEKLKKIKYGEILFNSVDRDGTGMGLDIKIIPLLKKIKKPIILMGGAGKFEHFYNVLIKKDIQAVATANLFNFLGNGLQNTRNDLIKKGLKLVTFR